ncbi:hypothetical protein V493_08623 [Pseudogymnoascus sp. VKM F-4281 (FW-2241)]|nr:hypothetical protein V493_08623 [Pseudogymnoascus sp. VKM F-4281 (FW-2241)]
MASFCWIRPLQIGHGIRRGYQSRALLRTAYLLTYPKGRHPYKPLLFLPTRRSSTSMLPNTTFMSSSKIPPDPQSNLDEVAKNIHDDLRHFKHDKWGWVLYRCSYGDDEAWTRFQQIIHERSRKGMAERGFPLEVANSLEWTFVSDRTSFDGASRDQLRQHFYAWAAAAEKTEQLRAVDNERNWTGDKSQRYIYFIQVDEEALRSVVDADPSDSLDEGWVNLIRCRDGDLDLDWRQREKENVDEEDGDEGWMMIAAHMVGPDFYDAIGRMPQDWYTFYTPPPGLVVY